MQPANPKWMHEPSSAGLGSTALRPTDTLPRESIVAAFQEVLLRPPAAAELETFAVSPSRAWLHEQLVSCVEYRDVVVPLAERIRQEWRDWVFREPSDRELADCVARARHSCGNDTRVCDALADGSIRTRMDFRPINMEMDITNQCNLRCVMCHFSLPQYYKAPKRHLSVEKFAELGEQVFPRLRLLSLSFGTEPLLHKDIVRFFPILEQHAVPNSYMNTNGQLLREPMIEAMIQHGFGTLLVSIDAATKETYEQIRIGGSFDKLVSNLQLVKRMKERAKVRRPLVAIGFVLMRQNLHELVKVIDFAADMGAHAVNAMHMMVWGAVGNGAMAAVHEKERCNEALAAARDRAAEKGIILVAPNPFILTTDSARTTRAAPHSNGANGANGASPASAPPTGGNPATLVANVDKRSSDFGLSMIGVSQHACPFPWNFAAIDVNGAVVPCGWWQKPTPVMGNIHEQDFGSIWRGELFQALRQRHLKRVLEGPCSRCSAAGMGSPDAPTAFLPR